MSKHTPGPWDTDLSEHDHPYQDIAVRSGTRTICRVWIDDAPVHDYNAEQLANARLIAAAPELLEALRNLVEAATHHQACARAALAKARAAIAKAEAAHG